jgi:protein-tyrosine phosphatase
MGMSYLGRAALWLACAALGCDGTSDNLRIGSHHAAHPTPIAASGTGGEASAPSATGGSSGSGDPGAGASAAGEKWVLTPDLKNARDVGGTPLEEGGTVACGSIFRGPPLRLTSSGCEDAKALGIRTVIDLRILSEQAGNPDATCMGADFVSAPLPIPYGLSATDYLADLNANDSMAQVFHTFGDPARYPIYFHCTWGRDRTGVVGAVLLLTLGVSPADVMAEYMLSQASVGAYPDALEAVLEAVALRGGPDAFLAELGITPEEIAVMRSHRIE